MIFFNPLDCYYKSIKGAINDKDEITFRVKGNFDSVVFVLNKDGKEHKEYQMQKKEDCFELSLTLSIGLYFYHFKVDNCLLGHDGNYNNLIDNNAKEYQLSVYSSDYNVPKTIDGGIIYQIFPDRFCKKDCLNKVEEYQVFNPNWGETPVFLPNEKGKILNNDFFGGNIKGIISKIDYLKSLGVSCIYLNPIFKAYSNHRYDTGDYMQIDPLLGDKTDFIELINQCNKNGISIILDGVFNHTGDDSVYFNKYGRYNSLGAYQSKDSKYYAWFNFTSYPDEYESWWGIETLPSVNENSQSYIDFITGENGVIDYYTRLGISGWRLDVVDELPGFFVKKIRNAVKKANKDAILIGEVWEDASNKLSYGVRREYFLGEELDSVMNYPLKNAILNYVNTCSTEQLSFVIKEQLDHYPQIVLNSLMNILSTHDTCRLLSVLSNKDITGLTKSEQAKIKLTNDELSSAKIKVKIASLLQYTLYGVPSIYYGDEIGMQGFTDPLNRCCMDWDNGDTELLEYYKNLGKIRTSFDCFSGDFELVYDKNGCVCYKRVGKNSQALIVVNLSNEEFSLSFNGQLTDLLNNKIFTNNIVIKHLEYKVLIAKE